MAPADVESDRIAVRHDAAAAAYEEGHRLAHEGTPDGFHARALMRERVRLANRMQQQLWRYYPQFLDAVDGDVAAPWALALTTTHCAVCASGSGHEACRQEPDRDPASGGRQPPARRHLPLGSHRRATRSSEPQQVSGAPCPGPRTRARPALGGRPPAQYCLRDGARFDSHRVATTR